MTSNLLFSQKEQLHIKLFEQKKEAEDTLQTLEAKLETTKKLLEKRSEELGMTKDNFEKERQAFEEKQKLLELDLAKLRENLQEFVETHTAFHRTLKLF
jgi:predicted  nucleic acid-binding Zn-ribbon protein